MHSVHSDRAGKVLDILLEGIRLAESHVGLDGLPAESADEDGSHAALDLVGGDVLEHPSAGVVDEAGRVLAALTDEGVGVLGEGGALGRGVGGREVGGEPLDDRGAEDVGGREEVHVEGLDLLGVESLDGRDVGFELLGLGVGTGGLERGEVWEEDGSTKVSRQEAKGKWKSMKRRTHGQPNLVGSLFKSAPVEFGAGWVLGESLFSLCPFLTFGRRRVLDLH